MSDNPEIKWLPNVEDKDYPAAQSYLGLLHTDAEVIGLVNKLKAAKVIHSRLKTSSGPRDYLCWLSRITTWPKTRKKSKKEPLFLLCFW